MVCVLLHYAGKPGAENELGALLADFGDRAMDEEHGLLSYVVTQAMGAASHFVAHTQFIDWAAFEEHAETPHMNRLRPRVTALLDAPIGMEIYRGL